MRRAFGRLPFKPLLLLLFVPAALATTIIVLSVWPYDPYDFYGYRIPYTTVCPGEPVQPYVTRRVNVNTVQVEVHPKWVNADGGPTIAESAVEYYDHYTPDYEELQSPVLRVAPPYPGHWYVGAEYTTYWWFWIVPRSTVLTAEDDEMITVLEPTDTKCADRLTGG